MENDFREVDTQLKALGKKYSRLYLAAKYLLSSIGAFLALSIVGAVWWLALIVALVVFCLYLLLDKYFVRVFPM